MEVGIRELAKQAAAAAKAEREAQGLAPFLPGQKYRGVKHRYGSYGAEIRDPSNSRRVWLGSYENAEEAAYAYDITARAVQGATAKPNFPKPPRVQVEEDMTAAVVLTHFAEAKISRAKKLRARAEKLRGRAVRAQAVAAEGVVVTACHANSAVPPPPPAPSPASDDASTSHSQFAAPLAPVPLDLFPFPHAIAPRQAAAEAAVVAADNANTSVPPPPAPAPAGDDASTSQFAPALALVPLDYFPFPHGIAPPQVPAFQPTPKEPAAPQPLAFAFQQPPAFPYRAPAPATQYLLSYQAPSGSVPVGQHLYQLPPLAATAIMDAFALQSQFTMPHTSVAPEPDVPLLTWLASSAVSPGWKTVYASESRPAPAPKRRRLQKPPTLLRDPSPSGTGSNQPVTRNNFMDDVGSSSSSAAFVVAGVAEMASLTALCVAAITRDIGRLFLS